MSRETDALRAFLRERIGDGDKRRVALEAGIRPEHLSRLMSKTSGKAINPTLTTLEGLARVLRSTVSEMISAPAPYTDGISVRTTPQVRETTAVEGTFARLRIGTVRGQLVSAQDGQTKVVTVFGHAYVPIPHLLDPVAAGAPIPSEGAIETVCLTPLEMVREWVRGPIPFGRLVTIDVNPKAWLGDSMSPTIKPGAMLTVDLGPGLIGPSSFEDGSIYLVRTDDGITCKRVWRTGTTLNCHADNRHVAPLVLPIDRRRGLRAHIIGEVVRISNPVE